MSGFETIGSSAYRKQQEKAQEDLVKTLRRSKSHKEATGETELFVKITEELLDQLKDLRDIKSEIGAEDVAETEQKIKDLEDELEQARNKLE
jgi:hypothetical protein